MFIFISVNVCTCICTYEYIYICIYIFLFVVVLFFMYSLTYVVYIYIYSPNSSNEPSRPPVRFVLASDGERGERGDRSASVPAKRVDLRTEMAASGLLKSSGYMVHIKDKIRSWSRERVECQGAC